MCTYKTPKLVAVYSYIILYTSKKYKGYLRERGQDISKGKLGRRYKYMQNKGKEGKVYKIVYKI